MSEANAIMQRGKVIPYASLEWQDHLGCRMSKPVSGETGSSHITAIVVEIPAGGRWASCEIGEAHEVVAVVYEGRGMAEVDGESAAIARAACLYAPTGSNYSVSANQGVSIRLYIWQSLLPAAARKSSRPRLMNNLFNAETVFEGYQGNRPGSSNASPASMHFLFWPGTGCAHLSLHCGIQQPGQQFAIHNHPISEELFIGFEGEGQVYLDGEWFDFYAGDLLYAPPTIYHGTRNPKEGPDAHRFITCGGPVPYDVNFYLLANVSPEVV